MEIKTKEVEYSGGYYSLTIDNKLLLFIKPNDDSYGINSKYNTIIYDEEYNELGGVNWNNEIKKIILDCYKYNIDLTKINYKKLDLVKRRIKIEKLIYKIKRTQ